MVNVKTQGDRDLLDSLVSHPVPRRKPPGLP